MPGSAQDLKQEKRYFYEKLSCHEEKKKLRIFPNRTALINGVFILNGPAQLKKS